MLKDDILKELYCSRQIVSGEELAKKFGVTRNSVWKSIEAIRREGAVISASTNKGYYLEDSGGVSAAIINCELDGYAAKDRVAVYDSLPSTNAKAKEISPSAKEFTTIIAKSQTVGHGRYGRSFYSPDGGIYMSVIVHPAAENIPMLTAACAVATAEAIEKVTGIQVYIKWVNDLLVSGKKVCGILCESVFDLETMQNGNVIIGIGINCDKVDFPKEISKIATSLGEFSDKPINKNLLAAEVLKSIENRVISMDKRYIADEYRKRSVLKGKTVTVTRGNENFTAKVIDTDDSCALTVKTADGKTERLTCGEVSIKY